jgi:hypothetical protein
VTNVLKNILLVLASVVLCTVAAEATVRWLDAGDSDAALSHLASIPLAPGVERAWFESDPPPLPNRKKVSAEARELVRRVDASGVTEGTRHADMFKAWNSVFVGDPCTHPYLKNAPGRIYVYDPPDGQPRPPYRFLPDTTTPLGLVTNEHGFRGPPVPVARQPKTIRIAFVGASTTVDQHDFPSSYPEFIGHWLNMWAAAKKLDIRFEILNAGRESVNSSDIAAIVRLEVAPLAPDLVVYYEGANQFDLRPLVQDLPARPSDRPMIERKKPGLLRHWVEELGDHFALARRLKTLLSANDGPQGTAEAGGEWPKPDYQIAWPKDLDPRNPDISRADLPVNLPTILDDLEQVRATAEGDGAALAVASYKWLVKDGMVLDPVRHHAILEYLNVGYAPFHYRDLERLAAFQNRVLAKYAAAHGLSFLDLAPLMPSDPNLFVDAIHGTPEGVRLRGWIMLQLLVPVIERHLADGSWPKKGFTPAPAPAPFQPRVLTFDCSAKAK